MTLRQKLEIFREKNKSYFSTVNQSQESKEFMDCHDIAHVVFGCNTSLYGEGIVKIWCTFGTDLRYSEITKAYAEVGAYHLAKQYSVIHVLKNIVILILTIPKAIYRSRMMTKPWPFRNYSHYLDKSMDEIRIEFGINIIEQ